MPKMKTHKGMAKRTRVTGTGKVMHEREGMGHLLGGKSRKRKRRLKVAVVMSGGSLRNAKRLIGGA